MKTPAQWWADMQRDAERRAELLKLQDDLLAGANREVMAEALIERLRGELGVAKREAEELADEAGCERSANTACGAMLTEARERLDEAKRLLGEIQNCTNECYLCDDHRDAPQFGGAPPPAESTPVLGFEKTDASGNVVACDGYGNVASPDDIRERLEESLINRIAEAKAYVLGRLEAHVHCRACGFVLRLENALVADGCPCNSGRGVNHGIVARNTCTCVVCDPAQTGGARKPAALEAKGEPGTLMHVDREAPHRYLPCTDDGDRWRCFICGNPDDSSLHPKGAKP